jgi:hypothetical protein
VVVKPVHRIAVAGPVKVVHLIDENNEVLAVALADLLGSRIENARPGLPFCQRS